MNLLEHYIKKVHSVTDVTEKYTTRFGTPPCEPLLSVDLEYSCYGVTKRDTMRFRKSEYERATEQGYFMA